MKIRYWASLAIAALCLTGCSGFWNALPSTGGGTGTTTLSSGDFYVLNVATSQMVGLYVNAGTLTAIGNPYTLSAAPIAITVAPNNAFLYVSTLGGIFVYTINVSTGQLTLGNNGQAITPDAATAMQVDPSNSWLIEGGTGTQVINAIKINSSTGVLAVSGEAQITAALPKTTVNQVAISPDGTFLLVANGSGGTVTIPFNAANNSPFGSVGVINPVSATGASLSVAFDPIVTGSSAPRLFYIGETVATSGSNTGGLRAFNFSTVKEISGSPYAIGGLAPSSILPFSTGDFVYVVSRQTSSGATGVIAGFSVTSASSAFTLTALGSTFTTGSNPQGLVEDSTHAFVFAVDFTGSPDLIGYTIDSTKPGYLDPVISNSTGTDPVQAGAIGALH
ncbi:beta-propeller fold lactonase family protein [Telmatobacter sp. DSM 110680]|uniref:Beta-propeller fold lactonase family protein n=1 Tax=Telmatobacter sp. DSM 110680 TaxID=3036704 RepID=A0AAU7DJU1_9BACT